MHEEGWGGRNENPALLGGVRVTQEGSSETMTRSCLTGLASFLVDGRLPAHLAEFLEFELTLDFFRIFGREVVRALADGTLHT